VQGEALRRRYIKPEHLSYPTLHNASIDSLLKLSRHQKYQLYMDGSRNFGNLLSDNYLRYVYFIDRKIDYVYDYNMSVL